MSDMRVIFAVIITALLGIGLLAAKAFAFSIAWVLWPLGVLTLLGSVLLFLISCTNVI